MSNVMFLLINYVRVNYCYVINIHLSNNLSRMYLRECFYLFIFIFGPNPSTHVQSPIIQTKKRNHQTKPTCMEPYPHLHHLRLLPPPTLSHSLPTCMKEKLQPLRPSPGPLNGNTVNVLVLETFCHLELNRWSIPSCKKRLLSFMIGWIQSHEEGEELNFREGQQPIFFKKDQEAR